VFDRVKWVDGHDDIERQVVANPQQAPDFHDEHRREIAYTGTREVNRKPTVIIRMPLIELSTLSPT
jgi:hypothetical protein